MPTADTNNSLIIPIYEGIATVGSDYGTTGITTGIHLPLSKIVWGNESVSRRVSSEYPMPVDIKSWNGNTSAAFDVTGTVAGTGTFNVSNTIGSVIHVAGPSGATWSYNPVSVYGNIHGVTNGVLVGVTGTVNIGNTVAVFGISGATAINISGTVTATGGRYLGSGTDNITSLSIITGVSMGSSPILSYAVDSVRVRGSSGELYVPSVLQYMNGLTMTPIGVTSDALQVHIVNTGVTFSISLAATIGVTNPNGNQALKVQGGTTFDNPVLIKYYNADSVPVSTANPIDVYVQFEGTTADLISSIHDALTVSTKPVVSNLTLIKNYTALLSTINDRLTSGVITSKISEIAKPKTLSSGFFVPTSNARALSSTSIILKSGINLKAPNTNTSTVYVGSSVLVTNSRSGYPLEPGESIFIECDNVTAVYCYAALNPSTQTLVYIGS